MQSDNIHITWGKNRQNSLTVPRGTTPLGVVQKIDPSGKWPYIIAKFNNELAELSRPLHTSGHLEFLDLTTSHGFRVYQRTGVFLLVYAAKSLLGRNVRVAVEHSVSKNYYIEIMDENGNDLVTDEVLAQIEDKMWRTAESDIPIEKFSFYLEEGITIAQEMGLLDKVRVLKYRPTTFVNFYKLDWFYDYFYGPMAPSTGHFHLFRLVKRDRGFLLQFPNQHNPNELSELRPMTKITQILQESNHWARILSADTVGDLNSIICRGGGDDFISVNEALHEKKIAEISDMIYKSGKKLVLIAGPSSSGKTTFAHRLCIQLRVNGLRPHIISVDNYFRDAALAPRDEEGKPDFESLDHVNTELFNRDLDALLKGETITLPHFNFQSGKSEPGHKKLSLSEGEVLVVEGIHGLNEKLTWVVPQDMKFKIFISALTQLNFDDHNRIPTTDTRLLRRIVRDYQFRNYSAEDTINVWPKVLLGEEKHIFPFQEEADVMFNSALVYELCVMKPFVQPLLFNIPHDSPHYSETRRLIKFLDSFMGMNSENVPKTSILREFIGGSYFKT